MKKICIFLFFLICTSTRVYASYEGAIPVSTKMSSSVKKTININDSIIFNLSNATLTANYIDIPLYIISDDFIFSFDYALTFNLTKLTYSTTLNAIPSNQSFAYSSFFNPNDLYLRNTASSQQVLPSTTTSPILVLRFSLSAPCIPISSNDFSNVLTILNGTQCSNNVRSLNFNQFIPIADFNTGPTCINTLILFSDSSKISNGLINSWSWTFSNGNNSVLQNNINTYSITGTSATTLIVSTLAGCGDTIIKPITISQPPVSSFTYSYNCSKDTMFFANTSSVSIGTIISSQWYFGDLSALSYQQNPSHRYALSGFYEVMLTSTGNSSCTSTSKITISLRPGDINKDGTTDVNDFMILVPALGTTCD